MRASNTHVAPPPPPCPRLSSTTQSHFIPVHHFIPSPVSPCPSLFLPLSLISRSHSLHSLSIPVPLFPLSSCLSTLPSPFLPVHRSPSLSPSLQPPCVAVITHSVAPRSWWPRIVHLITPRHSTLTRSWSGTWPRPHAAKHLTETGRGELLRLAVGFAALTDHTQHRWFSAEV